MVEPQSIRSIDEPKRVFPTHLSHFSYRRHRKMGFGGKVEQVLTLPTVQIVFLWLVWMLRKKTAKVPIRKNRHFGVWYEKIFRLSIF